MIGSTEFELSALYSEEFLPKITGEDRVVVGHNRSGHAMQFEDLIHERLSDQSWCKRVG